MPKHYPWNRQPMLEPYEIEINSRGREYLNKVLVPHFSEFFHDGDRILFVGKHPLWDYSVFFNGPHKQCEFIVTDIESESNPDVVDDIAHSQFETASFDGIIAIGLYDSLRGEGVSPDLVTSEMYRILKPGGRILVALQGREQGRYNTSDTFPMYLTDEIHFIWGPNLCDKENPIYGDEDNTAILLIMRKKRS